MNATSFPTTAASSIISSVSPAALFERVRNRTFDELAIGDSAMLERTLTAQDLQLFGLFAGEALRLSGDPFPALGVITHGMWGSALVAAVLHTRLPGAGTVYVSQSLRFIVPVVLGDRLTIRVTVTAKDSSTRQVTFICTCLNKRGEKVIEGEAQVIAPQERIDRERTTLPEIGLDVRGEGGLQRLLDHVRTLPPMRVAVVHPCDALSLSAALDARDAGLIVPVLVAPRAKLEAVAAEANLGMVCRTRLAIAAE